MRLLSRVKRKRYTFAAGGMDSLIAKILPNPGYYIELGANDGITQSQTKYLELYCGWSGILIEPTPTVFNLLKRNRSKSNYFQNQFKFRATIGLYGPKCATFFFKIKKYSEELLVFFGSLLSVFKKFAYTRHARQVAASHQVQVKSDLKKKI
jgi:hypothetical protein